MVLSHPCLNQIAAHPQIIKMFFFYRFVIDMVYSKVELHHRPTTYKDAALTTELLEYGSP